MLLAPALNRPLYPSSRNTVHFALSHEYQYPTTTSPLPRPQAELEAEASVSAEGLTLRGSPPSDRLSEFLRRVGAATTALEH